MPRVLTDQNFNARITSALPSRIPNLDLVTAQDAGLSTTPDPELLEWCADERRILLTHDRQTMAGFAWSRIAAGDGVADVVIVDDRAGSTTVLADLELLLTGYGADDWQGRVEYVPL